MAGFEPDILVVADKSIPPFVLGMENFPCLTVFYAVDSHIQSWYPYYAQAFDICLLSLKDHIPSFVGPFLDQKRIFWSPPFAQDHLYPDPNKNYQKKWDCIFVGRVNNNTPKRKIFLDSLKTKIDNLYVTFGNYAELFPQAKVVLNFCEHNDLNFRVFEALGMGSALVTPNIPNGQNELFKVGQHFLTYDLENEASCLKAIDRLLIDDFLRAHLEHNGLELINAKHRAKHRAEAFLANVQKATEMDKEMIKRRQANALKIRQETLRILYLLWAKEFNNPQIKEMLIKAASKEGI
ncbi:MAG: glycosyltransferase family 1 protein [Desulfovibrionaceae bacterium]|nr:glycosyltransferase family 1 protein [Desulfovibrionaceae bacterium]